MAKFWSHWFTPSPPTYSPSLTAELKAAIEEHHKITHNKFKDELQPEVLMHMATYNNALQICKNLSTDNGRHVKRDVLLSYMRYMSSNRICMNFCIYNHTIAIEFLDMVIRMTDPYYDLTIDRAYPIPEYYQLMYNMLKWHDADVSQLPSHI